MKTCSAGGEPSRICGEPAKESQENELSLFAVMGILVSEACEEQVLLGRASWSCLRHWQERCISTRLVLLPKCLPRACMADGGISSSPAIQVQLEVTTCHPSTVDESLSAWLSLVGPSLGVVAVKILIEHVRIRLCISHCSSAEDEPLWAGPGIYASRLFPSRS